MAVWNGINITATSDIMGGLRIEGEGADAYLQPGDDANTVLDVLESEDLSEQQIDDLLSEYLP